MGLKEVLSKMKLVEVEPGPGGLQASPVPPVSAPSRPAPSGSPSSLPPRPASPQDVRDILASIPQAPALDEKALPHSEEGEEVGGLEIPGFEAIYRSAGITEPPHGYTSYKVLEILSSEDFAGLPPKAKAAALAGFLKMNPTGPVPIADVIQDAVRRDQALDKFEELLRAKLAGRSQEVERQNAELQAEIDALTRRNQERMQANRRTLEGEQERLGTWLARKRIEERRLFDAVGPFVEENPITSGGAAAAAPPSEPGPQKENDS